MTIYAGEKPQVRHWAKGYDDEQLTGADVSVTITIWDLDDTVLVDEAPMTYSATLRSTPTGSEAAQVGGWFYVWESPANAPGSYKARCTVVEMQAWEYKTIRLRRDKAPIPAP